VQPKREKSLKFLSPVVKVKDSAPNSISAVTPHQTLRDVTALPRTYYLDLCEPTFKIPRGRERGGRRENEERVGRRDEGKGERREIMQIKNSLNMPCLEDRHCASYSVG